VEDKYSALLVTGIVCFMKSVEDVADVGFIGEIVGFDVDVVVVFVVEVDVFEVVVVVF